MSKELLNDASKVIAACVEQLTLMRQRVRERFEEECLDELIKQLDLVLEKLCKKGI